jgi:hypothetical protein
MLAFGSVAEALDSLLEGDGFEPSVPVAREPVYIAEGELRGDRQKNWRGTDGSNPSPSSGESANHRSFGIRWRFWAPYCEVFGKLNRRRFCPVARDRLEAG